MSKPVALARLLGLCGSSRWNLKLAIGFSLKQKVAVSMVPRRQFRFRPIAACGASVASVNRELYPYQWYMS